MFAKTSLVLLMVGAAIAQPIGDSNLDSVNSIWKDTPMDTVVREFRDECVQQSDSSACIKVKVLSLLDDVLQKDTFKVGDSVSIVPNDNQAKEKSTGRGSSADFLDQLEKYVKGHDIVVQAPQQGYLQGATFKMSPRNLDQNELTMSVKLPAAEDESNAFEDRGRKSKLRKILIPILVFVLLKAMTLIPLAIGVLGLKAWNALQLSFISFLVSISLAIFQLCKKVASDSGSQISAHIPFETSHYAHARNFVADSVQNSADASADVDAHDLAYRNYAKHS